MKLVLSLVVDGDADVLDAQLAFHLNAGIDLVLATERAPSEELAELMEAYARTGHLRRIPARHGADDAMLRTTMAQLATDELGADWLFDTEPGEFWLPRGESLGDVLVAIPPRYGVVQALVRVFLPRPHDGQPFFERMTVRRAPEATEDEAMGSIEWALRPVYRARSDVVIGLDRERALDGRVPMRAWYPLELFRFPLRTFEQAERAIAAAPGPVRSRVEQTAVEAHRAGTLPERWGELVVTDEELSRGIGEGTLIADERLRDALRRLGAQAQADGAPGRFALPSGDRPGLDFPAPTVVDDVAYAVECAAVREVDFEPLIARIAELEQRIGRLEARFWPRARRVVSRMLRR